MYNSRYAMVGKKISFTGRVSTRSRKVEER